MKKCLWWSTSHSECISWLYNFIHNIIDGGGASNSPNHTLRMLNTTVLHVQTGKLHYFCIYEGLKCPVICPQYGLYYTMDTIILSMVHCNVSDHENPTIHAQYTSSITATAIQVCFHFCTQYCTVYIS